MLVFCGELADAAAAVSETASVQEATGIRSAPYGALMVSAWRGRPREAAELIETTEREAGARGEGIGLAISAYAQAVLSNGLGQYEDALAAAVSASEHREIVAENWGLSELVEPATRCGRTDLATDALNRLATKAQASGTDWARGIEARARALLAEAPTPSAGSARRSTISAEPRARRARPHAPAVRRMLRREGRRLDARAELNVAHELFTSMGMEAFAERAGTELLATGREGPPADRRDPRRSHRRRSVRSPSSPATGSRTRRSAPACSSASAPSSGTCATCSPSSASGPGASWEAPSSARAPPSSPSVLGHRRRPDRPIEDLAGRPFGSSSTSRPWRGYL
jgi:hypothetical protein